MYQMQDNRYAGDQPMIGQAVEMNEQTGSPANSPLAQDTFSHSQQQSYGLRDSDADINGMVGLQQDGPVGMYSIDGQRGGTPGPPQVGGIARESGQRSPTSIYSGDQQ